MAVTEYQSYGIALASILFIYYVYKIYKKNSYWKDLGVPYVPGVFLFGNDFGTAFALTTSQDNQVRKYNYLNGHAFGGTYMMTVPMFMARDPSLVEHIVVKDFSYFYNRGIKVDEKLDPLQGHLFNLEDQRWKSLRNKLTPTFTSGKLKTMHQLLIDCADALVEILRESERNDESVDFKETMAKFTTDVIGACAYGLNMNALKDPNSEFRLQGKKVFMPTFKTKIRQLTRMLLRAIHPNLVRALNFKVTSPETEAFFLNLVKNTIKVREENNLSRNDFIQLLINLRKQDKEVTSAENGEITGEMASENNEVILDDNVMAANAFLFFIAGFETTASTLSYCLFELSKNQEIQKKLYDEVSSVLAKYNDQPTYDAIKFMPYLDMVISETLRKYPPAPLLFRQCNKDYKVPESDFILRKGTRVEIPVYALQHDPNIFNNPEVFDPERFSEGNKQMIPKGAYLPFGDGPRNCIGSRFAQMEIKVALCKILSNFKVFKNPSMSEKLEFDPRAIFILMPKGEILLDIQARSSV